MLMTGAAFQSGESGYLVTPILERERVSARLREASAYPIVVIIAPAGFGKTTAIRQLLQNVPDAVYIQIPRKPSFQRFIREFAKNSPHHFGATPQLPEELPSSDSADDNLELYLAWSLIHLQRAQATIAIDDFQNGQSDESIGKFILRLIDATKGHINWIIASRIQSTLPITRWQAYGDCDAPITANDLRMTLTEAVEFAKEVKSPASHEQLAEWTRETDGFAVPLAYAIRLSASRGSVDNIIDGTKKLTFSFLAEQLWSSLKLVEQAALETASLLPSVHIHQIEGAGIKGASQALMRLCEDVPFFSLSGAGIFTMHDLFRDFIGQQMLRSGPNTLRARTKIAMRILESENNIDEAIRLLIQSADVDGLTELIDRVWSEVKNPDTVRSVIKLYDGGNAKKLPLGILCLQAEFTGWAGDIVRSKQFAKEILARSDANSAQLIVALKAIYRASTAQSSAERAEWLREAPAFYDRLGKPEQIQLDAYRVALLAQDEKSQQSARELIPLVVNGLNDLEAHERVGVQVLIVSALYWLDEPLLAEQFARAAVDTANELAEPHEVARTNNNLGIALMWNYNPEVSEVFDSLRTVVEHSGAWRYSHVSHWIPALYYALQGNETAAIHARSLQFAVQPIDATQRERLDAMRRHTANLINLIVQNYREVLAMGERRTPERFPELEYELLIDLALANSFSGNVTSSEHLLQQARDVYETLLVQQARLYLEALLLEIVCWGAVGRWRAARKLSEAFKTAPPNLHKLLNPLKSFCDGPPFLGLREALLAVKGEPYFGLAIILMQRVADRANTLEPDLTLTAAELDVLKLLSLGKSNKEIADTRSRRPDTIKRQISAIFRKLSATNRTAALIIARERGLI